MAERALDVQRLTVRLRELARGEQDDDDADRRDDDHRQPVCARRSHETADRAVHDEPREYEQERGVRLRRKRLEAA